MLMGITIIMRLTPHQTDEYLTKVISDTPSATPTSSAFAPIVVAPPVPYGGTDASIPRDAQAAAAAAAADQTII